ncbi:cyclodeaminase/cyclohydrolase family protein [Paenibacillus kobensis]|uniref:cyclodeaminase/cyclohydrolase family protein n=1 Tax=Paenibacillus kobensis TaxID=59841 RepID=UPI000FD722B6|nr:cyclodeaminase/cyclohydrolase family protein [Paenibacillus kobensis]
MSTSLWDQSIRHFIQHAASPQPTPGGGSIAALVGALAASMTSMVGHLSQSDKYADVRPQMDDAIDTMNRLISQCEQILQEDIEAFNTYMQAYRLPKVTDEEKKIRSHALQQAAVSAIEVPIRLIELCRSGVVSTHSIAHTSNPNVISDLAIGSILFEAAAQSALLTIEINLASLKDEALIQHYKHQLAQCMPAIEQLKRSTLQVTRDRLKAES